MGLSDMARKSDDIVERKSGLSAIAKDANKPLTRKDKKAIKLSENKCVWMTSRGCTEGNHRRYGDCINCKDYLPSKNATFKQKVEAENRCR